MIIAGSATDANATTEHAEMLATKWWSGEEFKLHGE